MTTSPLPRTSASGAGDCSCPELRSADLSRRGFLRGLGLAGATMTVGSAVVTVGPSAPAAAADASSVLVVLSMRGAADGLSLVVPHGDPVYYDARPRIAVAADITTEESVSGTIALADHLTIEDSGDFFNWNGERHAW